MIGQRVNTGNSNCMLRNYVLCVVRRCTTLGRLAVDGTLSQGPAIYSNKSVPMLGQASKTVAVATGKHHQLPGPTCRDTFVV